MRSCHISPYGVVLQLIGFASVALIYPFSDALLARPAGLGQLAGTPVFPTRVHRPTRTSAGLHQLCCVAKIPSGDDPYVMLRKQTAEATQAAIAAGITQIELEFPPVRDKLDISLGETSEANCGFARELARTFSARFGRELWLVFPDQGEAARAQKRYGKTTFTVTSIEGAMNEGKDFECKMQIVVNPGFSINEWINLDKIYRPGVPMVLLNGGLDKVRGGYYPRIFYPGLHQAKERFLGNFETAYYLKALPGGWLFRKQPDDWQIVLAGARLGKGKGGGSSMPTVLETSSERPDYNYASSVIKSAAFKQQQGQ